MTSQVQFGSYENTGAIVAVNLVNELALEHAFGRAAQLPDPFPAIRRILEVDPPSAAQFHERDVPAFIALATRLREVFRDIYAGDLDQAANHLNRLLAAHPAHPHLAKEHGRWRLHHHPADLPLVPMWTAICAEALARIVGTDAGNRLGTCDSDDCDRVFLDESKNASRRFCSTTCQNRIKAAAFRRRQAAGDGEQATSAAPSRFRPRDRS